MPKRDFNKLLPEAVDEGLSSLGVSSKQAIYFHLRKSFSVKKKEIPFKIEAFADGIEEIFGLGAIFPENLILKRLYERFGRSFKGHESRDLAFTEYVSAAKRSFLEKKKLKKRAEDPVQYEVIVTEGLNI